MPRILVPLLLTAALCASEAREAVLATIDRVIVPTFAAAVTAAERLAEATRTLAASGDADALVAVRAAYAGAKDAWERAEALCLGPASLQRFRVDFWPTRSATIARAIAGAGPLDPAAVAAMGSAAKGFPALDWLLFDGAEADLLADARRRAYAAAAAAALHEDLTTMAAQWDQADPDVRLGLVANSGGLMAERADAQLALDGLVNMLIAGLGRGIRDQVEKPLGADKGKGPRPQSVESPGARRGLRDLAGNLAGFAAAVGTVADAPSLASLLDARVPGSADGLIAAIATAQAQAAALRDADLAVLVVEEPARLDPLISALRALRTTTRTQVTAVLGVTIHFGDSDGD